MEPAERVFARDLNAARHTVECSASPSGSCVLTPGGARCHRIFIVGALTEWRGNGGDVMQARLADPTGTFRVSVDRQSPDVAATLAYIEPPAFVAVTGLAVLSQSGSRAGVTVAAEALNVVSRSVRDLWVIKTAEATVRRLEALQEARIGEVRDAGVAAALALYGRDGIDLCEYAKMVRKALEQIRGESVQAEPAALSGSTLLLAAIEEHGGARGISVEEAIAAGVRAGLTAHDSRRAVEELLAAGECYSPATGMVKLI